jgi:PAS domain S-box-containing protein
MSRGPTVQADEEHAPRRFEKLYLMLLEAIPSSVLMIDRNMGIIFANRNFLEKSRRCMDDTVGRHLEEIFPETILDHLNLTRQIGLVFEQNQSTEGRRLSYRAPGVPLRIYYYRLLPFSWDDTVESVMLLMNDVTEQTRLSEEVRRVERHLASVVDSASDIIVSTDIEGKILSWNHAAEKTSGFSFTEVLDHLLYDYFDPEARAHIYSVLEEMKTRKQSHMEEWLLITKNAEPVPVSWVCSLMKDESARAVGMVAVGRDLTEQRKLEAQLVQSQKFNALGVMAGGIAHEIRNPLAICSSGAQFLMDADIDADFQKECAEKIHANIKRASSIIENLLSYARPSASPEVEKINLTDLAKEIVALIGNQARIQKIQVKTRLPYRSVVISGNAGLLQQVFINLCINAIQAMPQGGLLVLEVKPTRHEVLISISDTGRGIPSENLDKIFDPFYTTSPVGMGTGLGLSICYSIIQQHCGAIEVESIEGRGSCFTVRLPLQP